MKTIKLGDQHNFGNYVTVNTDWVKKPRTVFWEFLFLSDKSLLRVQLDSVFKEELVYSPFDLFLSLDFKNITKTSGEVEFAQLENRVDLGSLSKAEIQQVGALLAMCFWFGIGDLHTENMLIGRNLDKLVCSPIDIESIFENMTHVTQTMLLPSKRIPLEKCGLAEIIKYIPKEMAHVLLTSFSNSVTLLNKYGQQILYEAMTEYDFNHPIRVIVKDTAFYKSCLSTDDLSSLFLTEKEQINRQDIPYYFRFYSSNEIYYWNTSSTYLNSGFNYLDLKLCTPIKIKSKRTEDFSKTFTTNLSLRHLCKIFGTETDLKSLRQLSYKQLNNLQIPALKKIELLHA